MIQYAIARFMLALATLGAVPVRAGEVTIQVHVGQIEHSVSRYLTGACLEDVNHEVYGGIDSQMIFGESFQEPARPAPLQNFSVFGGNWTPAGPEVQVTGGDGPKLVRDGPVLMDGAASVEVCFADAGAGNAGLMVKVSQAGAGRDAFNGYEVALEPSGHLVLGRHRQNWEPLRRVDCAVPANQWIQLEVQCRSNSLVVRVNDQRVLTYLDNEHPLAPGTIGLRAWQHEARFRNLCMEEAGEIRRLTFEPVAGSGGVSGPWRAVQRGGATGGYALDPQHPWVGNQSQRITFLRGTGSLGIENQGLNRRGLGLQAGKPYEGWVWVRSQKDVELSVALASRDGARTYAEMPLAVHGQGWQRLNFQLTPTATDAAARFELVLREPGSVDLGYALLQPGDWGRFHGLPVRREVGEGLVNQGITVLRYGGCMANAGGYRWKNMLGPRDRRSPYAGWWYPQSSNGWGIMDFLNFCEAAGFRAIPDVNMDETPADLADLVAYANGPADSEWGGRRVADGHPEPYHLGWLELGNEEKLNEAYWQKFQPLAEAIWAKDPAIILVVGDFAYHQPFQNPFALSGADGGITSLAVQQKILRLAKAQHREVWFDIHVNTDGPRPEWGGAIAYINALERLAEGARHRVVIFELNAGNHTQSRALANALTINALERDGRVPVVTSANALQPDGQNDNGWDQGLLFLNSEKTWWQPPGYVTQMIARHFQPLLVNTELTPATDTLDVTAKRSAEGHPLVLQVVNGGDQPESAVLGFDGFTPRHPTATVEELAAELGAVNTADAPERVHPRMFNWAHSAKAAPGPMRYQFLPHSFTVLEFE